MAMRSCQGMDTTALSMKEQERVTVNQRVVHRRRVELAREKDRSLDTDNGRQTYQSQSATRMIFATLAYPLDAT